MFNTVYGTARNDKNGYLYDRLKENADKNIKSYVLVPEQFSVFTERKLIENLGVKTQANIEVLTFSRLSNLIFESQGPLRLRYIDGAGREILARRTLQLIENKLDYFRPNVNQVGFSNMLVGLISEFKRYGLEYEELVNAEEKVESDELKRKLRDLALFYDTYNKLINEKNSDAEDNLSIILPKIKDFNFKHGAQLYISEFRSFTPLECDIIIELIKKMDDTYLIMMCDNPENPNDLFRSSGITYQKLSDTLNALGIEINEPKLMPFKNEEMPDLAHLRENYFDVNPRKYDGICKNIHIKNPDNYFDEVLESAKTINRLCREKGYKIGDFLILARDTDIYSRIMPLVFEKFDINVFLDKRRSIMENPYLRYIVSMLEVLSYGFSYERIITMARSGFCGDIPDSDIDEFENYILSVNPSHAMWNDEKEWTFNPDKFAYDMDTINMVKNAVMTPIFKFKHGISGRKTVSEIVGEFFLHIENCGHENIMKEHCENFSKNNMVYMAEEYRMTWNSMVSILSEFIEIMGDDQITYEKFYELFISACSGTRVGVSPQTIDSVVFSQIDLFRNTDAKVVIVLGVSDGVFPKGYGSEGLITDAEREVLRTCGIELAMTAFEKAYDEQLLVYNVLTAASDALYLMSPKSSNDGEPVLPSEIINKIQNELFDIDYEFESMEGTENAFLELLSELQKCDGNKIFLDEIYKEIYDFIINEKDYSERLFEFLSRLKSSQNGYEKLGEEMVTKLYGRDIMLSASKMEKFNSCAFSYFMRYGLYAKERDIAAFDPLSMGNILHSALEEFFSKKKNQNVDYEQITKEQCEREMIQIVGNIAKSDDEVMYKNSAYYKYLVMRMSGIAATTAWQTVKFFRISEFRPYGFEVKIGKGADIPPIRIETEYGSAGVEGFVDRIDSTVIDGKRYISVVDYKSSSKSLDKGLASAGVRFQPLVYTNAICNEENTESAAMLYFQMNDPIIDQKYAKTEETFEKSLNNEVKANGWVVGDEKVANVFDKNFNTKTSYISKNSFIMSDEMTERLKQANEKIKESAVGILSGEISVNPYQNRGFDPCSYCEFISICGNEK